MKKVLVFGVFDGVHDGHRALFRQAREYGEHLIVVVAPDSVVIALKGRKPKRELTERILALKREALVNKVIAGDEELGTYKVLKRHRPCVIALGYDQKALRRDLHDHRNEFDWDMEIFTMEPHQPEKYHSTLFHR